MHDELNPQAEQMADESMVRNLAAQATCIWPQEEPLFRRYGLEGELQILDAGCGTGEIAGRLADLYPRADVLGVDIIDLVTCRHVLQAVPHAEIVIDTLRAPRETFAAIWTAWRDGYAEAIASHTRFSADEVRAHFDDMIATMRDPNGYGAWLIPVVSGICP